MIDGSCCAAAFWRFGADVVSYTIGNGECADENVGVFHKQRIQE
jgi:hypothetical protein